DNCSSCSANCTRPSLERSCSVDKDATCSEVADDSWETALTLDMASDSVICECSSVCSDSVTRSSLSVNNSISCRTSWNMRLVSFTDVICSWKIGYASDSTATVSSIST